ncbi:hypothetical protein Ocin01_20242 [Orchesella cincta]|uniref:Uncharacterized protein n=1 Tax=Orchesella cincta TaxID=48709 RepID=A0A1D2M0E3_ORCCI|nr:hypothetical protein Ocin01_20242 [Orchesella cincta]
MKIINPELWIYFCHF